MWLGFSLRAESVLSVSAHRCVRPDSESGGSIEPAGGAGAGQCWAQKVRGQIREPGTCDLCAFSVLPYSPHLSVKSKKRDADWPICIVVARVETLLSLLALLLLQWFCSEAGRRSGTQPCLHTSNTQSEQQLAGGQRLKNVYRHTQTHTLQAMTYQHSLKHPRNTKESSRRALLHLLLSRMRTSLYLFFHLLIICSVIRLPTRLPAALRRPLVAISLAL